MNIGIAVRFNGYTNMWLVSVYANNQLLDTCNIESYDFALTRASELLAYWANKLSVLINKGN
jgi:hypothetical protein